MVGEGRSGNGRRSRGGVVFIGSVGFFVGFVGFFVGFVGYGDDVRAVVETTKIITEKMDTAELSVYTQHEKHHIRCCTSFSFVMRGRCDN